MREIKFRVWDSEEIISLSEAFLKYLIGIQEDDKSNQLEVFYNNVKLMQYTGLKDENGVEIYEGDIIKHDVNMSQVFYNSKHCAFMLNGIGVKTRGYLRLGQVSFLWIEVIGNTYENPELLKG